MALPLVARVLVADWDANPVEMAKGLVGAVVGSWRGTCSAWVKPTGRSRC